MQSQSVDSNWNIAAALREMLGYVNFSEGSPDAHFQKQLNQFYAHVPAPGQWQELQRMLRQSIAELQGSSSAFQDTQQAQAVIEIVFDRLMAAYRDHHRDLLFHLGDNDLLQPFFLARLFEAVLAQGGPWNELDRIIRGSLERLNDFVGYRPVAILERKRCEPYDHERVRPIPLFVRGAGVAVGKYHDIVTQALEILSQTDASLLREAQFDLGQLDELAFDPRAYDFGHPVNHRPNYQFGEWDPHCIDNAGRYRRFVLRQIMVDALLQRVIDAKPSVELPPELAHETSSPHESEAAASPPGVSPAGSPQAGDLLFESAAALAGTMLMAAATSGSGPEVYDSSVTLASLVPIIARLRDRFYENLIRKVTGSHGTRLREEAVRLHQPFGGARQYVNQFLARLRAAQLQHTHLARLYTEMGYPNAGRAESRRVMTASKRIATELLCQVTASFLQLDQGNLAAALSVIDSLEDLLHRGIRCGALVDPWNILGFQGQFSVFPALENTVPDPRVDELIELMEEIFLLYARLMSEAAAAGDQATVSRVRERFERLAGWWDEYATVEVGGIPHVHGRKSVEAASHVAHAMAAWREAGEQAGNVRFWRQYSSGFSSPRAFAQVVDALLGKRDYVAAMALLMSWLSQAADVPLYQEPHSFFPMTIRWLVGILNDERTGALARHTAWPLVLKFFDYMEANAEDYWLVPSFELGKNLQSPDDPLEVDSLPQSDDDVTETDVYSAAYDGVTYRDSAQDGHEGELVEGGLPRGDSEWEAAVERLEPRLQFLTTVATLLRIAADHSLEAHLESLAADLNPPRDPSSQAVHPERIGGAGDRSVVLTRWLGMLQQNQTALARLAQQIEAATVAEPTGSHDSLVEYDRKRSAREHLIHAVIATQTESGAAISRLLCALPASLEEGSLADWERYAVSVERALPRGESESIRGLLAPLLESLHNQPLLYRRLDKGGEASKIVAARGVQRTLRMLVESLPRAGMIRESYRVLQTAQQMERDHSVGEGITEFDHLARNALRAIVESVVQASQSWTPFEQSEIPLLECLEKITQPFMRIWLEHSQNLRLTALDRVADDDDWDELRKFIESYGRDLLTPVFLTLGNLRGILDHGAGYYLDYLIENPDPLHPVKLIESLDGKISRTTAERYLDLVMQVFVENYEEYKDYNATTTQSDYGDRFFILFEFLRVKAWYIRASWNLQPVAVVHEALARQGKPVAARLWCEALSEKTGTLADELLERVAALESQYGVRLATVRDLLAERFNRPLALDRVRLLIGPAMKAARTGNGGTTSKLEQGNLAEHESPVAAETKQAQMSPFDQFCEALRDFASTTSGVGLDVPPWLQVLEDTVHDERDPERASIESLQDTSTLRRARFSRKHVDSELDEWDDA